jgi:hypothetical protein
MTAKDTPAAIAAQEEADWHAGYNTKNGLATPVRLFPPSQKWKILQVVKRLKSTFTREALVVKCWQLYPKDFCLTGYSYPDAQKVYVNLYGSRGLIKAGILVKVGDKFRIGEIVNDQQSG